jgi:hypothetical protein
MAHCVALTCQTATQFERIETLTITSLHAITYTKCVCRAWASGIEDTKLFQSVECLCRSIRYPAKNDEVDPRLTI